MDTNNIRSLNSSVGSNGMSKLYSSAGNNGMSQLITLVNNLQDTFVEAKVQLNLDLPQIVVIGGQSAGKSSVLESFVGRDFLPRGKDIVTRRPLVLQLIYDKNEEYAEFLAENGHKNFSVHSLEEVTERIERLTDEVAGTRKGISSEPINLKIYSPNVINLTLVDLPGLTKVPIGDQPEDIEDQIRKLILSYATPKNALLLAISPANQDIANSDGLKLAREVDPEGERTIGVLTKLDLMDEGTDALRILKNEVYPLKRGYIGVVNRSQKDTDEKMEIADALRKEEQYFHGHPIYSPIAHKQGSAYLQRYLNEDLERHIKSNLPELKKQLMKKKEAIEAYIKNIDITEGESKHTVIFKSVGKFGDDIAVELEGHSRKICTDGLSGGAQINEAFETEVRQLIFKDYFLDDDEIDRVIKNEHGYHNPVFVPENAFQVVVEKILKSYEQPMNDAVTLISQKLTETLEKSVKTMSKFPALRDETLSLMADVIGKQEDLLREALSSMLEAQMSFLNTNHSQYKTALRLSSIFDLDGLGQEGAELKNETVLLSGWLFYSACGTKDRKGHDCYFVLTPSYFRIYESDKVLKCIMCVPTDLVKMHLVTRHSVPSSKITGYRITVECKKAQHHKRQENMFEERVRQEEEPFVLEKTFSPTEKTTVEKWEKKMREARVRVDKSTDYDDEEPSDGQARSKLEGSDGSAREKGKWKQTPSLELRRMVRAYMDFTQENLFDSMQKYITYYLMKKTIMFVREELYPQLIERESDANAYLQVSEETTEKLKYLKHELRATEKALEIIQKPWLVKRKAK